MRTLLLLGLVALATAAEFVVTPTVVGEFPHYYENCVGSCHALMALRADWREQMKKAHDELGFKMVRFHGLFDDDMSVLLSVTENGTLQLSLYNVFSVFDFLRSIDMRPIVELSFMPEALASGKDTIFHYKGNITPPKSYAQWNDFIRQFMQGLIARYGIVEIRQWFFEVWNEPNCGFFTGTQAQYFELLENTVRTIKGVDTRIPVGGPATCQTAWIAETVAYAQQHNFPLDFVSTHEYPTDVEPVRRDIMKQVVLKARAQAGGLPVFYTEFNDGLYFTPSYHDRPFAAAFIMQNVYDVRGLLEVFSWWTFSDLFEEGGLESQPFLKGDGWGLLNMHGIPKPSYRAYQILHQLGDKELQVTTSGPASPTLQMFAVQAANGSADIDLVLYNHQVIGSPIAPEAVTVTIAGVASRMAGDNVQVRAIDDTHANAPRYWESTMGAPQYLTAAQVSTLARASELQWTSLAAARVGADIQIKATLTPEAVWHVRIPMRR